MGTREIIVVVEERLHDKVLDNQRATKIETRVNSKFKFSIKIDA